MDEIPFEQSLEVIDNLIIHNPDEAVSYLDKLTVELADRFANFDTLYLGEQLEALYSASGIGGRYLVLDEGKKAKILLRNAYNVAIKQKAILQIPPQINIINELHKYYSYSLSYFD
ncbi:MAG: hypothetical protein AABW92_06155 [Nanoarchaeota archaeon]